MHACSWQIPIPASFHCTCIQFAAVIQPCQVCTHGVNPHFNVTTCWTLQDYRRGQDLVKNRDFKQNEAFFKAVFEVGRRYKIMNPDRMRATYGKLLYMLMDTAIEQVAELLEFSCVSYDPPLALSMSSPAMVPLATACRRDAHGSRLLLYRPLLTVRKYLEAAGASAVLDDPRLEIATAEIDGSPDRPRAAIQADLARKESARKALARAHATNQCPPDDLLSAVYSLADHHTYLLYNRDPVERMIEYLHQYFHPRKIDGNWSLAISSGACLLVSCMPLLLVP